MAKTPDHRKYKVLHIPTSSYLMVYNQSASRFDLMVKIAGENILNN